MLKIKLSRIGKKGQPYYRIIVAERRSKRDGQYIDLLGTYNPTTNPKEIKIDQAKYQDWIKKGAQATQTVDSLYHKAFKK
ncbi:30S ribosomal protein S16 [Candidatus Beckwithbacteria bacterium]|nr:30S ribosomal protein S16 [Candidatus Beckwithbacteria bacterium]